MIVKTFTTAAAAIALTATPVMAQTAEIERNSAQIDAQAEMLQDEDRRGPGLLLGVLALAVIIAGILILAGEDGDDEDVPTSP